MGEVWFGYDKRLDRPIAIKFIRIDRLSDGRADDELTRRFVRESRITARMNHPGVPVVYDCGTHEDKLYLVMQQIEGCSVSDLIAEVEPLPVPWAAAIAAQVCSVLAAAHANSLVHRDLKPSNLMICPDGSVKVLDFGVAAALTPDATKITATGTAIGTPEYMAPEQALSGTTSPQSDLYSLGVVLDEMLTGRNQFSAPTPLASMRRHLDAPPTPPRKRRPDVPEELERLVLWLLEKTPDRRPPDAATVYDHLVGFCRELPPLPGFVDQSRRSPARMYTSVLPPLAASGRSAVETPPPPRPVPPRSRTAEPTTPTPSIGRTDIELAMQEAKDLKGEARFSQAAEVLARVVEPATRAFGAHDAGVIDLRIEYADVLFLGGDYRRAAPSSGGSPRTSPSAKGPTTASCCGSASWRPTATPRPARPPSPSPSSPACWRTRSGTASTRTASSSCGGRSGCCSSAPATAPAPPAPSASCCPTWNGGAARTTPTCTG